MARCLLLLLVATLMWSVRAADNSTQDQQTQTVTWTLFAVNYFFDLIHWLVLFIAFFYLLQKVHEEKLERTKEYYCHSTTEVENGTPVTQHKVLVGAMSLQALQSREDELHKAAVDSEQMSEELPILASIQSSSFTTREVQTVSAEVCCVCCKCDCHQPAPPTRRDCHQPAPPTRRDCNQPAPPTRREVGVQADRTLTVSYSKNSPPKSRSEPTFLPYQQSAVVTNKVWPSVEPKHMGAGQYKSEDPLEVVEGEVGRDKEGKHAEPKQEVGKNESKQGVEREETKQEVGSTEPKQEVGSKASKQEVGRNEPKQEATSIEPEQEVESLQGKQELGSTDSKDNVESLDGKQKGGSLEKAESGECAGGPPSSELECREASHDTVAEAKSPPPPAPIPHAATPPAPIPKTATPPAPIPQIAPPPKQCPPVPARSSPTPLPEASPSPVPEPCSSSNKEDDYSTVADALALAEGERVVVVKRPSISGQCSALPSHFKVLGTDDYCEVIFANTDDETPLVEAGGEGGIKRVRTLPRQVRQDKEEVVKLKERSFSLRGKPPYPKGRRPVDTLPAPPPSAIVEEALVEKNPHHEGTTEDAAMATEVPKHLAAFQILENDEGENPAITSSKLSKSTPTTPAEREAPATVEGAGQGRVRASTAYTMVSYKKKMRNRSLGEKDELDEPPTHYFVDAPPSSPTTHPPMSPAKSPKSPSHIPISKSPSSPIRSSPSHISRRIPRSDYEEVDLPKRGGGAHGAYEEVKLPSRIPTPRRQNPSPTK